MKKLILMICICLLSFSVVAQEKEKFVLTPEAKENIKQSRIKFLQKRKAKLEAELAHINTYLNSVIK